MRAKAKSEIKGMVEARRSARVSQSTLCKKAGVCIVTLIKFEKGRPIRPALATALRQAYADIMGTGITAATGGLFDEAWLRRQTDAFLKSNCLGIVDKGSIAHFVLSSDAVFEYGRKIMLSLGKNIR